MLADIFEWVARWGVARAEITGSLRDVTVEDKLADLQRAALLQLTSRGTVDAIEQLERLTRLFAANNWLQLNLEEARTARRRQAWQSYSPHDVLTLILGQVARHTPSLRDAIKAKAEAELTVPSPSRTASELLTIEDSITISDEPTSPPEQTGTTRTWKVLAIADEWASRRGGISTFNRGLCVALASVGCEVRCLVPEAASDEIADAESLNVRLEVVPPQLGFSGHDLLPTWTPSDEFKPDVVLGHDHVTGKYALLIAKTRLGGAFLAHVVHTVPEEIELYKEKLKGSQAKALRGYEKGAKQRELCEEADLIIAVGPTIEESVRSYVPHRDKSVLCLIPGYDRDLAAIQVTNQERLPLQVLFVGRAADAKLKGVDIVLGIASLIGIQPMDGERPARFVIRGIDPETDEDQIGNLLQDWRELNRRSVIFRPYSTDTGELRSELLSSSCVLMPSRTEGFGLVALEALAAGKPILVTSASGFARHLLHVSRGATTSKLVNEWILDVHDDAQRTATIWVEAVRAILEKPQASLEKAREYRKVFDGHFDWQTTARLFLARITELKELT